MHKDEWKSFLGGAALAAVLILPTLAHGETAIPDQPKVIRLAEAGGDWKTSPRQSFDAKVVRFDSIVGTIKVEVKQQGPVTLQASGTRRAVDGLSVHLEDGVLKVDGNDARDSFSVWDWRKWFDFSDIGKGRRYRLMLTLSVPRGTALSVDGFVGDATIGDTMGALDFTAHATRSKIGKVQRAQIQLEGAGEVNLAEVKGPLKLEIDGSGRLNVGDVQSLDAELNGSGKATIGAVQGALDLDIAGSGNLTATKVVGPVDIDIAGAGSVKIADGYADPFKVDIAGAGDVFFGGTAVNPSIDAFGAGKVKIHAIRGKLNSEGMASVKIGD